jgi:hypothetical protein
LRQKLPENGLELPSGGFTTVGLGIIRVVTEMG